METNEIKIKEIQAKIKNLLKGHHERLLLKVEARFFYNRYIAEIKALQA